MKYGIANIKGGSGGTTIPTLTITQSQLNGSGITLTQEQYDILANNDIVILQSDYLGKRLVMQKIRWDGEYSADSLTPQTTILFQNVHLYTSDSNENVIENFYLALQPNQLTCYFGTNNANIPTDYQQVCFTSASPSSDSDGDYFEYGDIDGDLGSYSVIIQLDASGNALKVYTIDWIDYENAYLYVSEKASVGGKQLYIHNVYVKGTASYNTQFCLTIINDSNVAFTGETLIKYLQDNNYTDFQHCLMVNGKTYASGTGELKVQYIRYGQYTQNSQTFDALYYGRFTETSPYYNENTYTKEYLGITDLILPLGKPTIKTNFEHNIYIYYKTSNSDYCFFSLVLNSDSSEALDSYNKLLTYFVNKGINTTAVKSGCGVVNGNSAWSIFSGLVNNVNILRIVYNNSGTPYFFDLPNTASVSDNVL